MARRTEILNYLANRLRLISTTSGYETDVAQVHRSYKYLNDINDFPTICFGGTPRETWSHYGDGAQLQSITQHLRGYVQSDEDSLDDSEQLARDIERVVNQFEDEAANLSVMRAQVVSLTTDEGLLSPSGMCDVEVEILYAD